MKKNLIFALIAVLLTILLAACRHDSAQSLAIKKSRDIISGYKAVFSAPPKHVPSFNSVVEIPVKVSSF